MGSRLHQSYCLASRLAFRTATGLDTTPDHANRDLPSRTGTTQARVRPVPFHGRHCNDPLPFVSKSFRAITAGNSKVLEYMTVSQGYTAYGTPET